MVELPATTISPIVLRIHGELFDGVREIAGQRAHEELAAMVGVVLNARHHFGAAEALRDFRRRTTARIAPVRRSRRRRTTVVVPRSRARPKGQARAVQRPAPSARAAGREAYRRLRFASAPRRMVWQRICPSDAAWASLARKAEGSFEMLFEFSARREAIPCPRRFRPCTLCTCPACGRR